MKKSLFVMMITAALMGGQVFATDPIPTSVEGYAYTSSVGSFNFYYGAYKDDGSEASGGNVSVSASETGSDNSRSLVYGGYSTQGGASDNIVTMTGGQVMSLYGGQGKTTVSGNTVIMTGGKVTDLFGGSGGTTSSVVTGNVAIVAGNCEITDAVYGGDNPMAQGDSGNKIYLVGKGATATIADAQGNTDTYEGGAITLNRIYGSSSGKPINNSLDIYGTGITATGGIDGVQILNFHIAGALAEADEPMYSRPGSGATVFLTNTNLGFYSDDVQDWSAFDGKSITLVSVGHSVIGVEGSLGEVEIKGADGATVATATLALENDGKILVMSNIKGTAPIPEPTTGTLGLLALAGLCIRRRK